MVGFGRRVNISRIPTDLVALGSLDIFLHTVVPYLICSVLNVVINLTVKWFDRCTCCSFPVYTLSHKTDLIPLNILY